MPVDSFYAYIITAGDDEGIMYGETAAGHRIPMLAETAAKADALRPIVERLATLTPGHRITLVRYAATDDQETICSGDPTPTARRNRTAPTR